jgi:hypothetical protein
MIPRIIHRVWLGSEPMPDDFRRYGETWREHHPDWEMRLWTDGNLPELSCQEAFSRSRHHLERSEVLRYELLRQFGGVYVDTDLECLRSIEPLIEGITAFGAWERPRRVGTCVLGSVPHHPAFERVVEEVSRTAGRGDQGKSTGPTFLTPILTAFPDVTIVEKATFHPVKRDGAAEPSPDAYAIHHAAFTGREPYDLDAELSLLRGKLATVERRLSRRQAQLAAIEQSAWWRLGRRLTPVLRVGDSTRRFVRSRR